MDLEIENSKKKIEIENSKAWQSQENPILKNQEKLDTENSEPNLKSQKLEMRENRSR